MHPTADVLLNRLLARGKFRHVQVLLKLAELGSVQRTADAIGMTQSSVTQTLAYLEDLLQTPLFHRHARGVRPTPACVDLLPVARQVMVGIVGGAEVVGARRRGQGIVRLTAAAAATNGLLVQALPGFHRQHPEIQVHLNEVDPVDLLLGIPRGEVDLVACRRRNVVPEGWVFTPLLDDRFVVACGPTHPLLRRKRLAWDDLAHETWLQAPAGSAARERFDELAARWAEPPATHPLVSRTLTITWWLLRQEPLLDLVPWSFVRHLVDAGELALLPLTEPLPMEPLGLLAPQQPAGEATARLIAHLLAFGQAATARATHAKATRGRP